MTGNIVLQWLVTVLAAAVVAFYVPDLSQRHGPRTRLNAVLHLVMAAGMTAMVWPFGMAIPALVGALVFAGAAAVYGYQILVPEPHRSSSGLESHHHRGVLLWYHLLMMVAMAWMYVAMGLSMASMKAPRPSAMAMPMPMHMSAGAEPAMPMNPAPGTGMSRVLSGWPALASWVCLLLFVVALVVFAGLLLRSVARRGSGQSASERRRTAASVCMAAVMLMGFGLLVLP
ncbi:DUF5134 domain-containing protein [Sinomonas humi]|uniref:DUF5134 domain-containing protein n=1 Tax=Sinomonas humi TaxID=1338436 RepID=A0A0B2AQR7_9MICC|nr:DUF5134 domain-containing protein [Sinomonas humi]KHL04208.1 hypothetical protein LK10_06565 [Sinomonas humi]